MRLYILVLCGESTETFDLELCVWVVSPLTKATRRSVPLRGSLRGSNCQPQATLNDQLMLSKDITE